MYRRLLSFLRPHRWRMAGTVACNIAAAVLDVFSFTLLIPFLDRLFDQPPRGTPISAIHERIIGSLLDEPNPQAALRNIIVVILAAVTLKNLFVWASGQQGAQFAAAYRHGR